MKTENDIENRMREILWTLKNSSSKQTYSRRRLVQEYDVLHWVITEYRHKQ